MISESKLTIAANSIAGLSEVTGISADELLDSLVGQGILTAEDADDIREMIEGV